MNELYLDKILRLAQKAGFEAAEVYYTSSDSFQVRVYESDIDDYRVNKSIGISFRGLYRGKVGYSYSEAADSEAIPMLIDKAMESANVIENDDKQFMHDGTGDYQDASDAFSPALERIGAQEKIDIAKRLEKLALGKDPRVTKIPYDVLSTSSGTTVIKNTLGLNVRRSWNHYACLLEGLASDGAQMYTGSAFSLGHNLSQLDLNQLAEKAVSESVAYIGAQTIPSGKYQAVLRADAVCGLFSTFSGVFSADNAQKGLSLLAGKEHERIASDAVTLMDAPLSGPAFARVAFDDEGVATYDKYIIRGGRLETLLHNLKTAHKQGVSSTGNASKASYRSPVGVSPATLLLVSGEKDFNGLLEQMGDGLVVTELQGMHAGANAISGNFSLAAKGLWVENGKVIRPVEQITVAGNFFDLLKSIEQVGNDVYTDVGSAVLMMPSVLLSELSVAGA